MVKFTIDIQTDIVIIAFRKYKSLKRKHYYQSIIIWWVFGSTIFKIIKDYNRITTYDFDIINNLLGAKNDKKDN